MTKAHHSDPGELQPFRIVIEGVVPALFLPTLLDGVRKVTPVDGGFTLSVGTLAGHGGTDQENRSE